MQEGLVALIIFICLATASLGSLAVYPRLPARYREDDTSNVIRLIANIFVVMTSLVLGLIINSAKNTLESVDRNVHTIAADLIVLDRTLRQYGPDARATREHLLAYAQRPARKMQQHDPMVLIFASFGYRAPRNAIVVASFLLSSLLLAAAIYLILDMDAPFAGPVKVSSAPLLRAVAEMQQ